MTRSTRATNWRTLALKVALLAYVSLLLSAAGAPCQSGYPTPSQPQEQPEPNTTKVEDLTWYVEFLLDKAMEDSLWCEARADSLQRRIDNPPIVVPSAKKQMIPVGIFIVGFITGTLATVGIYKAVQ